MFDVYEIVSVLLDEFVLSVERAKKEEEQNQLQEKERRKLRNCLDPVTKCLLNFEDDEDLDAKINLIFDMLDEDESGGLNFEVLQKTPTAKSTPVASVLTYHRCVLHILKHDDDVSHRLQTGLVQTCEL